MVVAGRRERNEEGKFAQHARLAEEKVQSAGGPCSQPSLLPSQSFEKPFLPAAAPQTHALPLQPAYRYIAYNIAHPPRREPRRTVEAVSLREGLVISEVRSVQFPQSTQKCNPPSSFPSCARATSFASARSVPLPSANLPLTDGPGELEGKGNHSLQEREGTLPCSSLACCPLPHRARSHLPTVPLFLPACLRLRHPFSKKQNKY